MFLNLIGGTAAPKSNRRFTLFAKAKRKAIHTFTKKCVLTFFLMMMKHQTQSIPIIKDPKVTEEDVGKQYEAMIADFQDYLFYSRLVHGLKQRQNTSRFVKKRQNTSRFVDSRYQNQVFINRLTKTRNAILSPEKKPIATLLSSKRSGCFVRETSEHMVASCVSDTLALIHNQEDDHDLIFDLEV